MATGSEGRLALGAALMLVVAIAGAVAPPPAAPDAEPVAMITDVSGPVIVKQGDSAAPAELLMGLPAGAGLTIPGGARLTLIYYGSAKEYRFTGPDSVTLGAAQPSAISGGEADARTLAALAAHRIDAREVQQLVQAGLQMRSADLRKRIQLRGPVESVVTGGQPVFSWSLLEPDVQYRFTLRDDAGLTLLETLVARTRLQLPAEIALKAGASYSWTVEARARSGATYAASADFSVASAEQRATLDALRAGLGGSPSEQLIHAILLQKLGLRAEAAGAWQQLAQEHPGSAALQRIAAQAALAAPAPER